MPFMSLKQKEQSQKDGSQVIRSIPVKSKKSGKSQNLFGLSFYNKQNLNSLFSLFGFNPSNPDANSGYSYSSTEFAYTKQTSVQKVNGFRKTSESEYVCLYPAKVNLPSYIYGPRPYTRNENDSRIHNFIEEFLLNLSEQFADKEGRPRIPDGLSFAITVPIEKYGRQSKKVNEKIRVAYELELINQLRKNYGITGDIALEAKTFEISYVSFAKNLNEKNDKHDWKTLRNDIIKTARRKTGEFLDSQFISKLNSASTFQQFQKTLMGNPQNIFFGANHHLIPSINEQIGKLRTAVASDDCSLGINEKGEITYNSSLPQEYRTALYSQQDGTKVYLRMPDKSYLNCTFRYDSKTNQKKPYLRDEQNNIVSLSSVLKDEPVGSTATIYDSQGIMLAKWIKISDKLYEEEPKRIRNISLSAPVSAFRLIDQSEEMKWLLGGALKTIKNTDSQFKNGKIKQKFLKENVKKNHEEYFSNYVERCKNWLDGKTQNMPEELKYNSIIVISDAAITDDYDVISDNTGDGLRDVLKRLKEKGINQKIEFIMVAPETFYHPMVGETLGEDQFSVLVENVSGTEVPEDEISNLSIGLVLHAGSENIRVTWIVSPDVIYREFGSSVGGRRTTPKHTPITRKALKDNKERINTIFKEEYFKALKRTTG